MRRKYQSRKNWYFTRHFKLLKRQYHF